MEIRISDEYLASYIWKICGLKCPKVENEVFIFVDSTKSAEEWRQEFENGQFGAYDTGVARLKKMKWDSRTKR